MKMSGCGRYNHSFCFHPSSVTVCLNWCNVALQTWHARLQQFCKNEVFWKEIHKFSFSSEKKLFTWKENPVDSCYSLFLLLSIAFAKKRGVFAKKSSVSFLLLVCWYLSEVKRDCLQLLANWKSAQCENKESLLPSIYITNCLQGQRWTRTLDNTQFDEILLIEY